MARKGGKDRGLYEWPKKSGTWWICYIDGEGKRHREKVGSKGLARRVYEKRKTEVREGRYFPPERRRVVLFDEIARDYEIYCQASGRRVQSTDAGFQRLLDFFGGRRTESITRADVETFQMSLSLIETQYGAQARALVGNEEVAVRTLSPATINRHLILLKAIFNRAIRAGKVTTNPVRGVSLLKENNIRVRYLTPDEETRLLEVLPNRLHPLIIVAIYTGMRHGELLRLRWEDVDFYSGTITVCRAKSGEGRRLPMNTVIRDTLLNLRQERIQEGRAKRDGRELLSPYVFCAPEGGYLKNFYRDWYPALHRAGLRDLRFHDLRHTFASRLVMAGVDLYSVQILLGHKTPAMTLRYAHLSPGHLRQAVETLVPETPATADSGRP
ncbi:MAG: tyrosine-type recombinase/integrase [Thermoplasmata archaeon]